MYLFFIVLKFLLVWWGIMIYIKLRNFKRAILHRINNSIDIDKNDLSGKINSVINSYFNLKEKENRGSNDNKPTNDLGDLNSFSS